MKTAQIFLSYHKQGDDLHSCLENNNFSITDAFENHAHQLDTASKVLTDINKILLKYPLNEVEINADCHFISITGPSELIDELVERELAWEEPFDEMSDEYITEKDDENDEEANVTGDYDDNPENEVRGDLV